MDRRMAPTESKDGANLIEVWRQLNRRMAPTGTKDVRLQVAFVNWKKEWENSKRLTAVFRCDYASLYELVSVVRRPSVSSLE